MTRSSSVDTLHQALIRGPGVVFPADYTLPLTQAIDTVVRRGRHRFHFPFHAGHALIEASWGPQHDLTELPELDVLGDPAGVLAESQQRVAQQFGAAHSFYLINGASMGLTAAMLVLGQQQTVILARNAHRSVLHGVILAQHTPVWVLPQSLDDWGVWGQVTADTLDTALMQTPDVKALVVTYPTYEGLYDTGLKTLIDACHQRGVAVIVDEAHGTLWPLHPDLPDSALTLGADIVVHSCHKSAGAPTQTAVMHVNHHSLISVEAVQASLNLLQTTSPSYPLLMQLEQTLAFWQTPVGLNTLAWHIERCSALKHWIQTHCQHIQSYHPQAKQPRQGPFQLILRHSGLSGETLAERLEEEHDIAFESYNHRSVLLSLNIGLDDTSLEALKTALRALDTAVTSATEISEKSLPFQLPQPVMTPSQAFFAPGETIETTAAIGRIAKTVIAVCPPGIPVVIPGERIQPEHQPYLPEQIVVAL
jgi:lysine decarboxylase